jgi:surface polysaccharide O-acyltransferase-like enzyme
MSKALSDHLKGLAILMVVWIHIQAFFPIGWWLGQDWLALTLISIDQIGRICVPLFVFLSWYGLAKKYGSQPAPWSLLIHTAQKLVPLYLIWSGLMFFLMDRVPKWAYTVDLLWWEKLLLGQADYQLYFVPMIMMLYAGFILVSRLSTAVLKKGTWLVGITSLAWYFAIPSFLAWSGAQHIPVNPDQLQYLIPLTWLWYAWLGLLAGKEELLKKAKLPYRIVFPLLTLACLGWAISTAWTEISSGGSVLLATMFTRLPVLIGVTFALLTLIAWQKPLNRWNWPWLAKVGVGSYVIYLVHTQLIRLTLSQWQAPLPIQQWLLGVGVVIVFLSVHFAWTAFNAKFSRKR